MQILLNQDEILEALDNYVRGQIAVNDDQTIDIDLKAGRGENGYTATLDIRATKQPEPEKPASKPAQKAAKPEPVDKAEQSDPAEPKEAAKPAAKLFDKKDEPEEESADNSSEAVTEDKPRTSIFAKVS
jgi:outer membrane biosynthesis protein TonB